MCVYEIICFLCCFFTPEEVMFAREEGHVFLNYPTQDKKFQANPAHDLRSQKSFSSDRVASVKQLDELVERRIGCSDGMVKDQPSLSYEHKVDSELSLMLQTGEYYVVPTHEDGSSKFLQSVNLLPELLKLSGEHDSVYMGTLMFLVLQVH